MNTKDINKLKELTAKVAEHDESLQNILKYERIRKIKGSEAFEH
jgi:hypothetical protein